MRGSLALAVASLAVLTVPSQAEAQTCPFTMTGCDGLMDDSFRDHMWNEIEENYDPAPGWELPCETYLDATDEMMFDLFNGDERWFIDGSGGLTGIHDPVDEAFGVRKNLDDEDLVKTGFHEGVHHSGESSDLKVFQMEDGCFAGGST